MTAFFEVAVSAVMTVAVFLLAAFAGGYGWHRIVARYTRRSPVSEYARAGRVRNPR